MPIGAIERLLNEIKRAELPPSAVCLSGTVRSRSDCPAISRIRSVPGSSQREVYPKS
ncbi:hypothetical protein HMPREF1986_01805 [Oribacterium sp. oral taxon 078 str. F0263]|nr:hypothetical protein HMPREF1986_01805 [Oribacterium sp. oral taxon 078 str. F0263]